MNEGKLSLSEISESKGRRHQSNEESRSKALFAFDFRLLTLDSRRYRWRIRIVPLKDFKLTVALPVRWVPKRLLAEDSGVAG